VSDYPAQGPIKACPNCGASMNEGEACPECPHDEASPCCECAFCEAVEDWASGEAVGSAVGE